MRSVLRYAKAWAVALMVTRLVFILCLVALVMVVIFGGGGELKISWNLHS